MQVAGDGWIDLSWLQGYSLFLVNLGPNLVPEVWEASRGGQSHSRLSPRRSKKPERRAETPETQRAGTCRGAEWDPPGGWGRTWPLQSFPSLRADRCDSLRRTVTFFLFTLLANEGQGARGGKAHFSGFAEMNDSLLNTFFFSYSLQKTVPYVAFVV